MTYPAPDREDLIARLEKQNRELRDLEDRVSVSIRAIEDLQRLLAKLSEGLR